MKTMNEYYGEVKEKYSDAIILFRGKDNYFVINHDVEPISKLFGLDVVENENGNKSCGFRQYQLDSFLPKIIRSGYRVAIADGCCFN